VVAAAWKVVQTVTAKIVQLWKDIRFKIKRHQFN
jgi:hypothetical protein